MLEFCDKPYCFFPPRSNPLVTWLAAQVNRHFQLPRFGRIETVEVSGHEQLNRGPARVLFAPNHPTHSDPYIYLEALRQIGLASQIMAAYDVFLRSRWNAWLLPRLGAFSVDREGSDSQALKQAVATLTGGRQALTIFPEGNVYLQNDLVTPFHEGAAFAALKAARELDATGGGKPGVMAVPVSIKVTHVADARDQAWARLQGLGRELGAEPARAGGDPLSALGSVGLAALRRNQRLRGLPESEWESPREVIQKAVGSLLDRLERGTSQPVAETESPTDRIRRLRRWIHQVRIDPERAALHEQAAVWADEAMFAFRLASYTGQYVASKPSLDRFAETVLKFEEDIHSRIAAPIGARTAYVRFGRPIDVVEYLPAFAKKPRLAVRALTTAVESAVQLGLDELNGSNPHVGGRLLM